MLTFTNDNYAEAIDILLNKRKGKPKAKRVLTKIRINELSIVDKPAVPEATFIIAKRLTPEERDAAELLAALDCDAATAAELFKAAEAANERLAMLQLKHLAGSVTGLQTKIDRLAQQIGS